MNRFAGRSFQWVFYLTASFYFGAVFLRSWLVYRDTPQLGWALGWLVVWLSLAASEPVISRRWSGYFPIYLVFQTGLAFILMAQSDVSDYFAVLLIILSMQVMSRLNPKLGWAWIGLSAVGMVLVLQGQYGSDAIALALVFTAGNILLGSYTLATRRAQAAHQQSQKLSEQLQEANRQLEDYSTRLEGLAIARERTRMARELHDSVTQTVFSMSLAAQSAYLLLDRDLSRIGAQLDRSSQLVQYALAELQLLISELPPTVAESGLVAALHQHLARRAGLEDLPVTLHVEGDQALGPLEEQGLFRIIQEALNNVLKHAPGSQACISLHLQEPLWVEIEDQGPGFNVQQALLGSGVGLSSMRTRAAEMGWDLKITTAPGAGTRIRVEKAAGTIH